MYVSQIAKSREGKYRRKINVEGVKKERHVRLKNRKKKELGNKMDMETGIKDLFFTIS